ncbi:hypothetical protein BRADI_1g54545v3 [Brachypodium distachyon]|uniref:Uncharacterized protein n=1 Tax=Brachypodium distachyon TaxID=15368 RepID=I1H2T5_BRADI|nr:hypothetical protein BRADI_1g54545v3 [Brachypodium distachyon]
MPWWSWLLLLFSVTVTTMVVGLAALGSILRHLQGSWWLGSGWCRPNLWSLPVWIPPFGSGLAGMILLATPGRNRSLFNGTGRNLCVAVADADNDDVCGRFDLLGGVIEA